MGDDNEIFGRCANNTFLWHCQALRLDGEIRSRYSCGERLGFIIDSSFMLCIRFSPRGKRRYNTYRIVVVEKQRSTDGTYLEDLGSYDPHTKLYRVNRERIAYWKGVGAKLSPSVENLLKKSGDAAEGKKPKREGFKKKSKKVRKAEAEVKAKEAEEKARKAKEAKEKKAAAKTESASSAPKESTSSDAQKQAQAQPKEKK